MPNNPVPYAAGARYFDHFTTRNRFYGFQLGLSSEARFGSFFLDAGAKAALGVVEQEARVGGATVLRSAGGTTTAFDGGVLAPPGTGGTFTRGRFAVAAELAVRAGYEFTPNARALVGYDFLYLSGVARPGGWVGPVESARIAQLHAPGAPSAARPASGDAGGGFWAEGLTCGLEFRY